MRRILILMLLALLPFSLIACGGKEEIGEDADLDSGTTEAVEEEDGLVWRNYAEGMALARAENKFALVDFWTAWCHWCKVMDKDTYSDPSVKRKLAESFVAIKVNAESDAAQGEGAPTGREIASQYQVSSYPTTWFLDAEGQKIAPLPGFMPPSDFGVVLDFIATGAYQTQKFQEYQADKIEGETD